MKRELSVIRYATGVRGSPLRWGETDCASLCIAAINLQAEKELISDKWDSEAAAREVMARHLPSEVMEQAGMEKIDPSACRVGDVLVVPSGEWAETLYLCLGARCLSATARGGVDLFPLTSVKNAASSAWRVP